MNRHFPALVLLLTFAAAFFALLPVGAQPLFAGQQDKTDGEMRTIIGVVDQSGGSFVLSTQDRLRPIAKLRGGDFSDDNFARFVGSKVRITGKLVTSGDAKVLTVRSLEDIVRIAPTAKE
jgi:hypothetical protein